MPERHVLIGPTQRGLPHEYGLVSTNGPSMVRVDDRYLLYFAHHLGDTIRLAVGESVTGPFELVESVLHRADTPATGEYPHIASPDVHILDDGSFRMYFHAPLSEREAGHLPWWGRTDGGDQHTIVAHSNDGGRSFAVTHDRAFAPSYVRAFRWSGAWWAVAMPGIVLRSDDGLDGWEHVADILPAGTRHCAVRPRPSMPDHGRWEVWFTRKGDAPERIVHVDVDPATWKTSEPTEVLRPERMWEGIDRPSAPSEPGIALGPQCQLRDPFVFDDTDGSRWLLYAFAGEQGIGVTRIPTT